MIKKILRSAAVSAGALLILSTCMILTGKRDAKVPENEVANPFYTVREYERIIGVFSTETTTPEKVHPIFVRVLPESDQVALENGISVSSEDELRRLIEDLSG